MLILRYNKVLVNGLILVISLLLSLALTGCGGTKPIESSPLKPAAAPTATSTPAASPTQTSISAPTPTKTSPTPSSKPISSLGKIVFVSDRDGNDEIYVMDADGSNQMRLTNNTANDISPKWSPDGRKIAFLSDKDWKSEKKYDVYSNPNSDEYDVYIMNADGSNQMNITNNDVVDYSPTWSPDGSKIAFISNRYRQVYFPIFVVNADGSSEKRLTKEKIMSMPPFCWSPDGSKIVFCCGDYEGEPSWEIYVINADGSNMTILTDDKKENVCPVWSPDGSKIAFLSGSSDFEEEDNEIYIFVNGDIYVMNADGSDKKRITDYSTKNTSLRDILWSPDGKKIAYEYWYVNVENHEICMDLYIMNPDGSNQICLKKFTTEGNVTYIWSPDGSKIAYFFDGKIFIINADGSNEKMLTENGKMPDWSH